LWKVFAVRGDRICTRAVCGAQRTYKRVARRKDPKESQPLRSLLERKGKTRTRVPKKRGKGRWGPFEDSKESLAKPFEGGRIQERNKPPSQLRSQRRSGKNREGDRKVTKRFKT